MHFKGVIWTLGVLAQMYAASMLLPAAVDILYADAKALAFGESALLSMLCGGLLIYLGSRPQNIGIRDAFLIVSLTWLLMTVLGALPFWLEGISRDVINGLFESASGLTTTGATTLSGLDRMDHGILFWRSLQQWIGGMGIIVFGVAVLPMLGIGGMQLFKAEAPGPVKDKISARVTGTAKVLWLIYLSMTLFGTVAYHLAGMGWFDAINHGMTTISTGGFSTHDASFGYFQNHLIWYIATLFMFLAGINFTLHFAAVRHGFSLAAYLRDEEFRTYLTWVGVLVLFIWLLLVTEGPGSSDSFAEVLFNTVSVITSTGFAVTDFNLWPSGSVILLLLAMFVGGCAGSTAGGIKIIRVLMLFRQSKHEIFRMLHPNALVPVKINGMTLSSGTMNAVWGFVVMYVLSYALIAFVVAMTGVEPFTALSAAIACVSNIGPGFNEVGPANNYAALPDEALGILAFGMILGRLEIFTLLALLTPMFWRK